MATFQITDIMQAAYRLASITAYNRLETSPRTPNFDRSLKAEIRDPLWMLTRQWQFGEFQGEDAATAVNTRILGAHTTMNKVVFPGANNAFAYNAATPLETAVERETLKPDLFLAVQMGRYFIRAIKNNPAYSTHIEALLQQYALNYMPDENDYEAKQLLEVTRLTIPDGYALYQDIIDGNFPAVFTGSFTAEIDAFKKWYQRNYSQPAANVTTAWQPSELEYKFAVTVEAPPQQPVIKLLADHYHEGHLDWYSFDLSPAVSFQPAPTPGTAVENIASYIPAPVSFKGMPNPRFWAMEDSQVNFGKIDTSPTGLLHLLLAEFGLICSNDWFILPYQLSINTLCELKGLVVTDVFGQQVLVRPAGRGAQHQWQRWAMFHHTDITNTSSTATNTFYLAPAIPPALQGAPLEQVNFLRDEMANLVWAVEKTVPSQSGKGVSGDEMAVRQQEPEPFISTGASIRYVLGTTVPDNWIPFIPVHMEGSDTETQLQRASMPGAKGALGTILREKEAPYYISDGIVTRSGVEVQRSFQRTRWHNGQTHVWIGRRKGAGKGEGWSNLVFDQIENVTQIAE
jgi:hypothetical protein